MASQDKTKKKRCAWCEGDPLYIDYHDKEWGVPLHGDTALFEFLTLEAFQAGLSWLIVLRKREAFRGAFAGFDPRRVARFNARSIQRLLRDASIIRNRAKLEAAVGNARAFLAVQEEHGSFDRYIWGFTDGRPIVNHRRSLKKIPAHTPLAVTISKDLKARGFAFVGPTVIYAHMQATGMVNDHLVSCFRHAECQELA
jgi:DNA-3-methyladenine glycosylase I